MVEMVEWCFAPALVKVGNVFIEKALTLIRMAKDENDLVVFES
jgi:hypothetical protein